MTGCFKIFHLDWMKERQQLFDNAKEVLSKEYEELNSPNFYVNSLADIPDILVPIPELNFHPDGYWDTGNPTVGWTKGEIPIFVANYVSWKNFLETDHDFLILCEDDIVFHSYGVPLLKHYMTMLPEDWDVFSFYCPTGQYFKYRDEEHKIGDGPISRAYQDHHLLCYVVSRKGAENLIKDAESHIIMDPIDWFIFYQNDILNVYTVKPREEHGVMSVELDSTVGHSVRCPLPELEPDTSLPLVSHWQRWHAKRVK